MNQQMPMNQQPQYSYQSNSQSPNPPVNQPPTKRRKLDIYELSDQVNALISENSRLSSYVVEMSTALNLLNTHVRILAEREAERHKDDERRKHEDAQGAEERRQVAEAAAKAAAAAAVEAVTRTQQHAGYAQGHNQLTKPHAEPSSASQAYPAGSSQIRGRPRKSAPPAVENSISVLDLIPQLQSKDLTPAQKEKKLQEFKQRLQLQQAANPQRPSVFL